jgi:DNA adenine methylase
LADSPIIVPFLKWAGGKRWLAAGFENLFPKKFNRYFEPFLGGGAIFLHLRPSQAILSDRNADLINLYSQIRDDWKKVWRALARHQRNHNKTYYYEERARTHHAAHERAAQFLYLNRTCWNGLYRVNLKGEFNVPIGTKDAVLQDTDDFENVAGALQGASLHTSDFEPILAQAECNDFVFVDPPYVTAHNFNGFVKYNEKLFGWEDQLRLRDAVDAARRRGAKVLMSNADHESVRSLYKGMGDLIRITRASVIAASSTYRGNTTELVLKTYE